MQRARKVLVVEDQIDTSQLVTLAGNAETFRTYWPDNRAPLFFSAYHGQAALAIAQWTSLDLVLLDLSLPDMDGFDVFRQLTTFSRVPIMIFTARNEPECLREAERVGAVDYVTKPFDLDDLFQRMGKVLANTSLH